MSGMSEVINKLRDKQNRVNNVWEIWHSLQKRHAKARAKLTRINLEIESAQLLIDILKEGE